MKKRLNGLIPLFLCAAALILELILSNFVYFAFVAGKTKPLIIKTVTFMKSRASKRNSV